MLLFLDDVIECDFSSLWLDQKFVFHQYSRIPDGFLDRSDRLTVREFRMSSKYSLAPTCSKCLFFLFLLKAWPAQAHTHACTCAHACTQTDTHPLLASPLSTSISFPLKDVFHDVSFAQSNLLKYDPPLGKIRSTLRLFLTYTSFD